MKNIIFFGPPGAGKGTQAKIISEHLNIPHLSTGDILRKKILEEDDLAKKLKQIMSSGKLVSDEILNSIVSSRLIQEKNKGFILDGFPRTLDQAYFLNNYLNDNKINLDFIIDLKINFEDLKKRIIKRSIEEKRDDDTLEILETRFSEYTQSTQKVSNFYNENNKEIYYEIDGLLEIAEITSKLLKIIKKSWFSAKY